MLLTKKKREREEPAFVLGEGPEGGMGDVLDEVAGALETFGEQTPTPATRPEGGQTMPQETRQENAMLGKGSQFEGRLIFEGVVVINGRFKGEINSDDELVVGEGAEVEAEIRVGSLESYGEIRGNVRAARAIRLHAPARQIGNLHTPSLQIEEGVVFEGSSRMTNLGEDPAAAPYSSAGQGAAGATDQERFSF